MAAGELNEDDMISQIVHQFRAGNTEDALISRSEFSRVLQVLDPATFDENSVRLLLARYDYDGSNLLDVSEFVEWLSKGVVSHRLMPEKSMPLADRGPRPLSINLDGYTCLRQHLHITLRAPKDGKICEMLCKVLQAAGLSGSYEPDLDAELDQLTIWLVTKKMDEQTLKELEGQFRRDRAILIYPSGTKHGMFIAGLVAEGIEGPTVEIGMNQNNLARAKAAEIDIIEMQWMSRIWTKLMKLQGVRTYDNEKSLSQAVYDFVMNPALASRSRGCTTPDGTPLIVGIVGSTAFKNSWTCKLLRHFAAELMKLNKAEGHREIVVCTAGFRNMEERDNPDNQGVGYVVAQEYYDLGGHVVHILPAVACEKDWSNVADHLQDGTFLPCDHGLTLFAGNTNDEHLMLMAEICDILFLVEGGPGAATQAKAAYQKNQNVVPVRASGGAAAGLFGMMAVERPIHVDRKAWQQIADESIVSSETVSDAEVDAMAKAMAEITKSAIHPLDAIEELHEPSKNLTPTPPWLMMATEELKRQIHISRGARICILGSTKYYNDSSEVLVKALACELSNVIPHGRAVFVTGGLSGVQETFAKSFEDESRLFHVLPANVSSGFGVGQDVHAGSDADEKRQVFANLGDIYITIEGGPGVSEEATRAYIRGAYVLPMIRTGGASSGLLNFPKGALKKPRFVEASLWEYVENKDVPAEEIARAVGTILLALIESIYPSVSETRRQASKVPHRLSSCSTARAVPLEWQFLAAATESLKTKMLKGTRICILGSIVFSSAESEKLVKALASELDRSLPEKSVLFITGGYPGVQQTFAEHCGDGSRVWNLIPAESSSCHALLSGVNTIAGEDAAQRKQVFGAVGDIYIVIEGDYDVACEARDASSRGAIIVPFSRTGGASNGEFGFPKAALKPPPFLSEAEWSLLGRVDVSIDDSAKAGVRIIESIIAERRQQQPTLAKSVSIPQWQLNSDQFMSPLAIIQEGKLNCFFQLLKLSEKGFRTYGRWSHAEASNLVQTLACLREFFQEFLDRSRNSHHVDLMKTAYIESGSKFRRVYSTIVKDVIQGEEAYERFIEEVKREKQQISQTSRKGQPTAGIGLGLVLQVYREAYHSMSRLNEFCKGVAAKSGARFLEAPLKRMFRSMEKLVFKYGAGVGDLQRAAEGLKDVARAGIQGNMEQLLAAFKIIIADENVEIVRIKNRFERPTDMGWADCQIMLFFVDMNLTHICEVQLMHEQLMVVRSSMGAHHEYARVRAASEMLKIFQEEIPALDPVKKVRYACKVKPSVAMSFPPQVAQSRQPCWQSLVDFRSSHSGEEQHRLSSILGDDSSLTMAVAFGIADQRLAPLQGKVSLRWESEELVVFDYHRSLTPLHLAAMPTAWRIPDWTFLSARPALALDLLEKIKQAFAEALIPFLSHEQWRSTVMREPEAGWPQSCDAAWTRKFMEESALLVVPSPAPENQLIVHCLVLPFYPWSFERFVQGIRPGLDAKGKYIYLETIESDLMQLRSEGGAEAFPVREPPSLSRMASVPEASSEELEKIKDPVRRLQQNLARWGDFFMGFMNEEKDVAYLFNDSGCMHRATESAECMRRADTWRLTSYGKPCEGDNPQGTYYGFPKKLEDVSLDFIVCSKS